MPVKNVFVCDHCQAEAETVQAMLPQQWTRLQSSVVHRSFVFNPKDPKQKVDHYKTDTILKYFCGSCKNEHKKEFERLAK